MGQSGTLKILLDNVSYQHCVEVPIFKVPESTLETLVMLKPADATSTGEVRNLTPKPSQPVNPTVVNSETKAKVEPSQIADDSKKEVTSQQDLPLTIISARAEREERLRKKAIALGEDPDKFVTITDEDKHNSLTFHDRMKTDARMCDYAKELEVNPHEHMDMTVRERLIGEEVIRQDLENEGVTSSWLDTDEEWEKVISILQENGMLW